jgi:hypothetical protein
MDEKNKYRVSVKSTYFYDIKTKQETSAEHNTSDAFFLLLALNFENS